MITNTGKDIIAKYLIGQAPSYAAYIALGCGPKPVTAPGVLSGYEDKTSLDMEMFRVPIISRGYVTDLVDGVEVSKVVFTAELPTEQRYVISEVGVYSAKSNPSATAKDSRILYAFTETENWEYHRENDSVGVGTTITKPLYGDSNDGKIKPEQLDPIPEAVFRATSDNAIFLSDKRTLIHEPPRFLNSSIFIPGNMSDMTINGPKDISVSELGGRYHGTHIHLTGTSVDLSKNSPSDEIKFAFSVVNKDEDYVLPPSKVVGVVEFSGADTNEATHYARFPIEEIADLSTNRYRVVANKLSELVKGTDFTWGTASVVKVYISVMNAPAVTNKALTSNVATLTTSQPHGFAVGSIVTVTDVDATFNGVHVITAKTDSTFSFAKTATDVTSTAVTGDATAEAPSDQFYVCADALRFENVTSQNPLYGLSGYSVVRTADGQPIVKATNTSNMVEFRFGLDVT